MAVFTDEMHDGDIALLFKGIFGNHKVGYAQISFSVYVIDFAIKDDPVPCPISHRLAGCRREIDDAQTAVGKSHLPA
jgi:hypothetical protein